jgi:hypothetical protein
MPSFHTEHIKEGGHIMQSRTSANFDSQTRWRVRKKFATDVHMNTAWLTPWRPASQRCPCEFGRRVDSSVDADVSEGISPEDLESIKILVNQPLFPEFLAIYLFTCHTLLGFMKPWRQYGSARRWYYWRIYTAPKQTRTWSSSQPRKT